LPAEGKQAVPYRQLMRVAHQEADAGHQPGSRVTVKVDTWYGDLQCLTNKNSDSVRHVGNPGCISLGDGSKWIPARVRSD